MSVEVGSEAPDLRLPAAGRTTVALADYRGDRTVVLAFYPKDFTGG